MAVLTSAGLTSIDRRGKMPFEIRQQGEKHCVFTKGTDHNHGCHATREEAIAQMRALYANVPEARKDDDVELEPHREPDYLIRVGPAVKAMGEGVVGGYLVQFGNDATKDAEDEWFTPETDFDTDFPARASIYYNHGMDPVVGRKRLTHGEMKSDDVGVWVQAQLDLRDRHQAAMYGMAKAGKLGWSSGSLAHLTDPPRERPGGAIKHWPLGHDASLTPIPSDKRNAAIALKSWEPPPLEELAGAARSQSLAENTDRWMDDGMFVLSGYTSIAAKAGRKLSAARRGRLTEMRQIIDDLLNETEPQEVAATEVSDSTPAPGMGEGIEAGAKPAGTLLPVTVPDLSDLYASAVRQHDHGMTLLGG